MEVTGKERIASVELFSLKVSEDEIGVYEAALSYILDSLEESEVEGRLGASREELKGMRDDLRRVLSDRETPTLVS